MISNATMVSMFVWIVCSFVIFGGLLWVCKRNIGIALKPLLAGSIGFIVITQVLEKALHFAVLTHFPDYMNNPWFLGVYGGMAAGVFEEFGRYLIFIWLLKKYHDYQGGISFGVGWGGIEAVIVTLMVALPNIIFAFMLNAGTFETTLAGQISSDQLAIIKETVVSQGASFYLFMIVERLFAAILQIALSLLILLAVVKKRFSFVIVAVIIHAVIDFPFAFLQTGHLTNLWAIESYLALLALLSLVFIKKAKQWMNG